MTKNLTIIAITAIISALTTISATLLTIHSSGIREQSQMVPSLLSEIGELQKEMFFLRSESGSNENAVSAFFEHMPFPAWLKIFDGSEFRMYKINSAYEKEWGVSQLKYESRTDEEIWGKNIAEQINRGDWYVIENLEPTIKWQLMPSLPNMKNLETIWIVTKFPVKINGRVVDAIGGVAIPSDLYKVFLEDQK